MTNKTKQTNKKYKDLLLGILNVLKYKENPLPPDTAAMNRK